ncbi:hypothetical protein MTsPCn5_36800 [Croceitalea sp. MTPC5]|nr:hypothetical protein MTsPCn5_36800 [Croceitalea sp. MTPC5]
MLFWVVVLKFPPLFNYLTIAVIILASIAKIVQLHVIYHEG